VSVVANEKETILLPLWVLLTRGSCPKLPTRITLFMLPAIVFTFKKN
jgi:hypothetical protein